MSNLLPFVVAMIVTMMLLPLLSRAAKRWRFVDQPGLRKVHTTPIPRVGGLAMAAGVVIAALLTIRLQLPDLWLLAGAAVIVLFGALDDRFDLDYRVKLVGQVLAVALVVFGGDVQIRSFTLVDRIMLPAWISLPLSVFFLVGITNAINLADGLDGLAGGTTFLSLCAVALLSTIGDTGSGLALALAFSGAVLGFLRFNTYPASVFMGDAGSQLLGYTIGVLSIRATQNPASPVSAALPLLLLALPILDTLSVMVQRISEGRSPFSPDKNHIHHKLLALGFEHHEAVMVIYAIQSVLFLVAYFLRYESDLLILALVTTLFAAAILALQVASRQQWQLREVWTGSGERTRGPLGGLVRPRSWARLTHGALTFALCLYAFGIVSQSAAFTADLRVFISLLLATAGFAAIIMRGGDLTVIERGALFVTAAVLVYRDTLVLPPDPLLTPLCWGAVGIAGIAVVLRLGLFSDRQFRVTPLDIIVLFMALVVPSLIGNRTLPHGGALAIGKLVIIFYGLELLTNHTQLRAMWVRIGLVAVLGGLALRAWTTA